jgi:hypothetical protein
MDVGSIRSARQVMTPRVPKALEYLPPILALLVLASANGRTWIGTVLQVVAAAVLATSPSWQAEVAGTGRLCQLRRHCDLQPYQEYTSAVGLFATLTAPVQPPPPQLPGPATGT